MLTFTGTLLLNRCIITQQSFIQDCRHHLSVRARCAFRLTFTGLWLQGKNVKNCVQFEGRILFAFEHYYC